jgi:hypothetical protein
VDIEKNKYEVLCSSGDGPVAQYYENNAIKCKEFLNHVSDN